MTFVNNLFRCTIMIWLIVKLSGHMPLWLLKPHSCTINYIGHGVLKVVVSQKVFTHDHRRS